MAVEHVKCSYSKSRCAVTVKCTPDVENIVPKKLKYHVNTYYIDNMLKYIGYIDLHKIYH